jgi:hypothetical protein
LLPLFFGTLLSRTRVPPAGEKQNDSARRGAESGASVDAVGGDFDFGNAAEGEQELNEVPGRLFGDLFHNVSNGVGDRGLEHDALGLEASQVHTHELAGLECR